MGMKVEGNNYTLILGDCLEVMPTLEAVDAVVTDPPYGNNTDYKSHEDTRDNLEILVNGFMPISLKMASRILVTCGVKNMWIYPEPTWTLGWFNPAGVGSSSWGFTCWQPILAYGKDPFLQDKKGRRPDVFFQKQTIKSGSDHPVEKPVNFMEWLLIRATRRDEIVLDPFMGSGTTGVAALRTGRKFIGIEKDPDYFEIARKRIENVARELRREFKPLVDDGGSLDGLPMFRGINENQP